MYKMGFGDFLLTFSPDRVFPAVVFSPEKNDIFGGLEKEAKNSKKMQKIEKNGERICPYSAKFFCVWKCSRKTALRIKNTQNENQNRAGVCCCYSKLLREKKIQKTNHFASFMLLNRLY